MQVYLNDIFVALVSFPFLALLITVPYMIFQYRKFGAIPWWRTCLVYLVVFYLLCAYFLVILPLPADCSIVVPYAANPQLIPFNSFMDMAANAGFAWNEPSTWLAMFHTSDFYEMFFNILLLVPWGMFLRYYFKCSWLKCLIIGFATALFFELSQLTGLFGLYAHPYRLFDVDDLITNTLGTLVGFWIMGPMLKWMPSMNALNQMARERGVRVSLMRRVLAFLIDIMLIGISRMVCLLPFSLLGITVPGLGLSLGGIELFSLWDVVFGAIFFMLVPTLTKGQTLGQKLLKLQMVRPNASPASWYQYGLRYGLFYLMVFSPFWLLKWLLSFNFDAANDLSAVASFFSALQPFLVLIASFAFLVWGVSIFVRNHSAKKHGQLFVMLNEHISGTRIMSNSGVKALREQAIVLDVKDVLALERMIAKDGVSLAELMHLAGCSVVEALLERNPEPTSVLVVCGSGNNGGDGWVVAYELAQKGYSVSLISPCLPGMIESEPARSTAIKAFASAQENGLPLRVVVDPNAAILNDELQKAEVVVDAILGTGFSGETVREPYMQWIKAMNKHHKRHKNSYIISVDVPSGYSAQKGTYARPCILADLTVTMLVYKPGLLGKHAARFCGMIKLASLVDVEPYLSRLNR